MKLKKVFPFLVIPLVLFIASCDKNDDLQKDRPQVTSTVPLSDAVNVNISTEITADFSVAMDSATINANSFTLTRGSIPVLGVVSYSAKTATFIPDNPLVLDSDYTASISTEAKDVDGNQLTAGVVWGFTTFSSESPEVVNLRSSENYVILAKTAITNGPA
ncbi:MAG: Ig-like domain-containing protein, partial [Bacteroidales bacterium]